MTWASILGALKFLAALLGFGRQALDTVQSHEDKMAGRAEAERDQAREGERVEGELASEAAKTVTVDDAIERLKKGQG